jgi:hypothetical protein
MSRVRGARRKLAAGLSLTLLGCLLLVSSSWAGTAAVPRSVTRTMHHYLFVHFIQDNFDMGPISVTCRRVAVGRFKCSWMTGPTGPGGYRYDYGGRANVIRLGLRWRVTRVVVTCSPDGLHDVCPGPPLTLEG